MSFCGTFPGFPGSALPTTHALRCPDFPRRLHLRDCLACERKDRACGEWPRLRSPMRFGIFYEHQLPRPWDADAEQQLSEGRARPGRARRPLGFDYVWEVEHHFLEEYSHSCASEVFLAAALAAHAAHPARPRHRRRCRPATTTPRASPRRVATLDLVSRRARRVRHGRDVIGRRARRLRRRPRDQARAVGRGARRRHADDGRGAVRRLRRAVRDDAAAQRRAQAAAEAAPAAVGRVLAARDDPPRRREGHRRAVVLASSSPRRRRSGSTSTTRSSPRSAACPAASPSTRTSPSCCR